MSAGTRCWLQAVARSATCQDPLDALSTITASTECAAEVPTGTPAHAQEAEQPNPLTLMRSLLGDAAIAAPRDCFVHGDPAVVGGALLVEDVVVLGAAAGGAPHPAHSSPASRQRPTASEPLPNPCRGRDTPLLDPGSVPRAQ